MGQSIWNQCQGRLEEELSEEHYETYIRPLQARYHDGRLTLLAPNIYVEEQVRVAYLERIQAYFSQASQLDEVGPNAL
mgnify:FL=1